MGGDWSCAIQKYTLVTFLHFFQDALNDHKLSLLFRRLTLSSSIQELSLYNNRLRTGIKSMVPFLQNASNLVELVLDANSIQSEGFNFLLVALCDSPTLQLYCRNCDIESIHIDNDRYPTNLEALDLSLLSENRINEDGCKGLVPSLFLYATITTRWTAERWA